jgi:hypothetical protein
VDVAAATEILARRPPAARPAWTRAQQTVLWHLVYVGGGEQMRKDFCGPKAQPDTDEPVDDTAEDEAGTSDR